MCRREFVAPFGAAACCPLPLRGEQARDEVIE